MAAQAQLSVEDYLKLHSEGPSPDYVEGELVERHMGGTSHGRIYWRLAAVFEPFRRQHGLHGFGELHLKITPTRYRIADCAIFAGPRPNEEYPSVPPLITVEIVSPDDSMREILRKCEDYQQFGVKHIWLVEPVLHELFVFSDQGLLKVNEFALPEFGFTIPAAQLFED